MARDTASTMVRFAALAGLSFVTNLGLTALLHEVCCLPEEAAFGIALLTVFAMNFLACRYVVFEGREDRPAPQLALFTLSSAGFRGAEYLAFLLVHSWLGTPYLVAVTLVLGASFVVKFFFYRLVVFERRR